MMRGDQRHQAFLTRLGLGLTGSEQRKSKALFRGLRLDSVVDIDETSPAMTSQELADAFLDRNPKTLPDPFAQLSPPKAEQAPETLQANAAFPVAFLKMLANHDLVISRIMATVCKSWLLVAEEAKPRSLDVDRWGTLLDKNIRFDEAVQLLSRDKRTHNVMSITMTVLFPDGEDMQISLEAVLVFFARIGHDYPELQTLCLHTESICDLGGNPCPSSISTLPLTLVFAHLDVDLDFPWSFADFACLRHLEHLELTCVLKELENHIRGDLEFAVLSFFALTFSTGGYFERKGTVYAPEVTFAKIPATCEKHFDRERFLTGRGFVALLTDI